MKADILQRFLRANAVRRFLDEWEAEHGAFTPEEIAEAEVRLGLRNGD